jgi:alpha 1,3-glucosidase
MVTIIDPHIKKDDDYHVYKEAKDLGIFVKDKSGSDFEGWCWPGILVCEKKWLGVHY